MALWSSDRGTYTNSLGMTFVLLPAGTFTMGSPSDEPGRYYDETQHQVTLTQPFYMQTTEVTQAQWEAVMGSNPSYFSGCPTCPVEMVSWDDVQVFLSYMNARGEGTYNLPTEAQWEYAARAGSTTAFYNGGITTHSDMYECKYDSNLGTIGWYCYNSDNQTQPVAQKAPNDWGLYDMSGNVTEWCLDWWDVKYYSSTPTTDPVGPSTGSSRIHRGGSWNFFALWTRSAFRNASFPDARYANIGFRLMRQPSNETPSKPKYLTEESWNILVDAVKNNPNPSLGWLTLQDIIDALDPFAEFLDSVGDSHFIGVVSGILEAFGIPSPDTIISTITISSNTKDIFAAEGEGDLLLAKMDFVESIGWMIPPLGFLKDASFLYLDMLMFEEPLPKEMKVKYGTEEIDLAGHGPLTSLVASGSYILSVVVDYFSSLTTRATNPWFGQEPSWSHFWHTWFPNSQWNKD